MGRRSVKLLQKCLCCFSTILQKPLYFGTERKYSFISLRLTYISHTKESLRGEYYWKTKKNAMIVQYCLLTVKISLWQGKCYNTFIWSYSRYPKNYGIPFILSQCHYAIFTSGNHHCATHTLQCIWLLLHIVLLQEVN